MKKVLPLLIAIFLVSLLTWPLLPNIASFYPDQGDYALNGAVLWYNFDSIKTGRIFHPKEYWQGFQFYPHPYSLAFANNPIAAQIFFAPIYLVTANLPLAVNIYAQLTLILSFLASFYTIRYFLSRSFTSGESKPTPEVVLLAALVGAFVFTFNAQTFARFPQHIDILNRYFLPLLFLFAYQFLEKPSFKKGFLVGLFFTLNALTHTYYPIFGLIMLPLVAIPFLISHLKKGYLGKLGKYGLVGVIFLPILTFFNLPLLDFSQKEGAYRSLESVPFFSARITDYFTSGPDNLIYGGWVRSIQHLRTPLDDRGILNYEEHTLFLGIIPMILFFIGLIKGNWGDRGHMGNEGKWYLLLLLIIPFIFTFGPYFNGAEEGFPLPFYWIYKLVPLMEGIRAPTRFEFLMFIPFSLIAAFGVLWLIKKRGIWVIWVIGVILILENLTVKNFDARSESLAAIERTGKENLGFLEGKGVLHLPIYTTNDADVFGFNSGYINWATQTHEFIVNGNTSYLPPDYLGLQFAIKQGLNDTLIGILKALDVNYLIYHKKALTGAENLIDSGVVLDNEDIRIVDLSKFKTNISICNLVDLDIRPTEGIEDLLITNKGSCYLISPKDKRYQQASIDIDDQTKKIFYRLPIVMSPNEQIVLSLLNREVRVE